MPSTDRSIHPPPALTRSRWHAHLPAPRYPPERRRDLPLCTASSPDARRLACRHRALLEHCTLRVDRWSSGLAQERARASRSRKIARSMAAARGASLCRLVALTVLVASTYGRRRHPSERIVETTRRLMEVARNESLASGPGAPPVDLLDPGMSEAWNASRVLTSSKLVDPRAHEVTKLPGLPTDWRGKHFAGMIESDDRNGGR